MANKLKTHSCDSKEQHLFELFCNIKNVFTVTFNFSPFCIKVLISLKKILRPHYVKIQIKMIS